MRLYIFLLCMALPSNIFASGVMNLKGKIHSFDSKQLVISTGRSLYHIDRSKVGVPNKSKLKSLKVSQKIALTIRFEAIKKVRHVK